MFSLIKFENGSSMEQLFKRGANIKRIKNSVHELDEFIHQEDHAKESLMRLSRALKDINEEVNLLKNEMKIKSK